MRATDCTIIGPATGVNPVSWFLGDDQMALPDACVASSPYPRDQLSGRQRCGGTPHVHHQRCEVFVMDQTRATAMQSVRSESNYPFWR